METPPSFFLPNSPRTSRRHYKIKIMLLSIWTSFITFYNCRQLRTLAHVPTDMSKHTTLIKY